MGALGCNMEFVKSAHGIIRILEILTAAGVLIALWFGFHASWYLWVLGFAALGISVFVYLLFVCNVPEACGISCAIIMAIIHLLVAVAYIVGIVIAIIAVTYGNTPWAYIIAAALCLLGTVLHAVDALKSIRSRKTET